ncbi:MAG: hypothetical protein FWF88_04445 [Peptococcaceae bacterium]|nr:hypothetical protein [Peptococcaceae bacterium]
MSTVEKTWLALAKDTSWTMALVETSEAGVVVKSWQEFEMSFADVGEGAAKSPKGLDTAAVKNWMKQHATGPSRIKIALDSAAVLVRLVELPRVSAKTLERHFHDNVSSYFDFTESEKFLDDHVINFKITDFFEREGHSRTRILLAALPKKLLTRIYRLTDDLGIDLASINIACECFVRVFEEMLPDGVDNAFVDLDRDSGHVFLLQNGTIVQYARVQAELERLFPALKQWESPESGTPLRSLETPPPGFGAAQGTGPFQVVGATGMFSEFAVVAPKMAEPELDELFVKAKDLPFSLNISDRDLKTERKNKVALESEDLPADDRTDALFADEGIKAALGQVFTQLREFVFEYTESHGLRQDEHPFARLYVTGIGYRENKFTSLLKAEWQDLLPVHIGFIEDWQPPLAQSGDFVSDWTRYVCFLGLILKTYDELK